MSRLETNLRQNSPGVWMLKLYGSVDLYDFQRLVTGESKAILRRLMETRTQNLIIDLAAVEQVDSLGLELLLLFLRQQLAPKNIGVILRQPTDQRQGILQMMQLDRVFRIVSADDGVMDEAL